MADINPGKLATETGAQYRARMAAQADAAKVEDEQADAPKPLAERLKETAAKITRTRKAK